MKKFLNCCFWLLAISHWLLAGFSFAEEKKQIWLPKIGEKTENFSLKNLQGETVNLKDFQGKKIIFLNFFATWCGPCQREAPGLSKVYPEYQKKDLEFIAVNIQEDKETVQNFVKKHKFKFPVLLDTGGVTSKLYAVRYIPTNFIVDEEGIIKFVGGYLTEENLRKELDKVIASRKPKSEESPPQETPKKVPKKKK